MRAKIEHQLFFSGIRRTPYYRVTVHVRFSETEHAIIKHRKLKQTNLVVGPGVVPGTYGGFTPSQLKAIARLCVLAGVVFVFLPGYQHWGSLFFIGLGAEGCAWFWQLTFYNGERDSISINQLLAGPVFIRTTTPLLAKEVASTFHHSLLTFKTVIEGNAELGQPETFEF